jgi:integrase/recombinase XerD
MVASIGTSFPLSSAFEVIRRSSIPKYNRTLVPEDQWSAPPSRPKLRRSFGRSSDRLGLEDVRAFQMHLVSTGISWPALNQTVYAPRFSDGVTLGHGGIAERIPYAREPRKLPVVPPTLSW